MPIQPDLYENYRRYLFAIAYRMLGSAMEAEDMVQEAFLRYERATESEIESPKAYLSTIVTRLCLDYLKSAKTQREEYIGMWLPEPIATDESPQTIVSERDSISYAFLILLENLSPLERAIFILRDVFDYPYAEIAQMVGKNEANCRRYYSRAKQYLMDRRPRFTPSTDDQKKLVQVFIEATTTGDIDRLTDLLAEDVKLYGDGGGKTASVRRPLEGREALIRFFVHSYRQAPATVRLEIAEVNGLPAILVWNENTLHLVMNFTLVENRITMIHNILNPDKLAYFQEHHPRP